MQNNLIFLPVLVNIAIVFVLYIRLAKTKAKAIQQGQVDQARRALHDDAWPDNVRKINNCIRNQFELPVLFYVLVFILWAMEFTNLYVQLIAWAFVFSRIGHAMIHTGSNYVPHRKKVFTFGCILLILLTSFIAASILFQAF
ncbi:MAPEG family protein [Thalassomonas haliotis]|uniref:MAPEG family protein n=1 Tax=Thalassomonas haliotis TaxID=485448 RepID=A0ABY7VD24_9GAMM|nr:MAPEG family protein [Thalassomonas haliotis]WDE11583.1 MAPEG family protein [Thalassomonas haliotis]